MDPNLLLLATAAILLGGFLKGATGAGAPVVGVPILAAIIDVQFAVAVFSVLNLFSNIWHSYAYRTHRGSFRLVYGFAIAGSVGAIAGSVLLASLPTDALMASLAAIVLAYIFLRLFQPDWKLSRTTGLRLVPYVGIVGGLMQGGRRDLCASFRNVPECHASSQRRVHCDNIGLFRRHVARADPISCLPWHPDDRPLAHGNSGRGSNVPFHAARRMGGKIHVKGSV